MQQPAATWCLMSSVMGIALFVYLQIFLMLDMHKSLQASLPVLQDLLVGAADRSGRTMTLLHVQRACNYLLHALTSKPSFSSAPQPSDSAHSSHWILLECSPVVKYLIMLLSECADCSPPSPCAQRMTQRIFDASAGCWVTYRCCFSVFAPQPRVCLVSIRTMLPVTPTR